MAKYVLRSRIVWIGLVIWLSILPIIHVVPTQELFEVENSLILAIFIGVLIGWFRAGLRVLPTHPRDMTGTDALILGVCTVCIGLTIIFANLWVWRVLDDPDIVKVGIINHWTGAFGRWILITGGSLLLAASGAVDNTIPSRSYLVTGIWISLGIAFALVLISVGLR